MPAAACTTSMGRRTPTILLASLALASGALRDVFSGFMKDVHPTELHYERQPRYHVRPRQGWLNDPNGPIFVNGKYHVFFQHNADERAASWGNIVWGHSVSPDLVHWEVAESILTTPPAYERAGAWSGSMFKRGEDIVALYTCTDGRFRNAQCEALADDASLSTFTRNPNNPVIRDPPKGVDARAFRDPTAPYRYKGRDHTLIGATDDDHGAILTYEIFRGHRGYEHRGSFYAAPAGRGTGGSGDHQFCRSWRDGPGCASLMLECPDVFESNGRTVLKLSLGAALRQDVVLIGSVEDGPTFRAVQHGEAPAPRCDGAAHLPGAVALDCGSAYAAKSFTDPKGRRVSWAWLPDWGGPATPDALLYNGTLTLPRLVTWEQGEVRARLLPELAKLRLDHHAEDALSDVSLYAFADACELRFSLPQASTAITLTLHRRGNELKASVVCVKGVCRLSIVTLADGQEHVPCRAMTFRQAGRVQIIVFLDGSVVEWDAGDGRASCAHRWYGALWGGDATTNGDLGVSTRFAPEPVRLEAWRLKDAYKKEPERLKDAYLEWTAAE